MKIFKKQSVLDKVMSGVKIAYKKIRRMAK